MAENKSHKGDTCCCGCTNAKPVCVKIKSHGSKQQFFSIIHCPQPVVSVNATVVYFTPIGVTLPQLVVSWQWR